MTSMTLTGVLSERDDSLATDYSMAAALEVVGRRASMLLLREAFYGAHRFDESALTHTGCGSPVSTEVHCAKGHFVSTETVATARRR